MKPCIYQMDTQALERFYEHTYRERLKSPSVFPYMGVCIALAGVAFFAGLAYFN